MRTLKAVRRSRPVTWWTHARNRLVTTSQGWATRSTPGSPDSLQTPGSPVRPPRPAMVSIRHGCGTRETMELILLMGGWGFSAESAGWGTKSEMSLAREWAEVMSGSGAVITMTISLTKTELSPHLSAGLTRVLWGHLWPHRGHRSVLCPLHSRLFLVSVYLCIVGTPVSFPLALDEALVYLLNNLLKLWLNFVQFHLLVCITILQWSTIWQWFNAQSPGFLLFN